MACSIRFGWHDDRLGVRLAMEKRGSSETMAGKREKVLGKRSNKNFSSPLLESPFWPLSVASMREAEARKSRRRAPEEKKYIGATCRQHIGSRN